MQGLIQWEPKCLLRTIIGRKEREAKWITNGWVPIQLLNLLERASLYALKATDGSVGVIDRVHGTRLKPYLSPLASVSPDVSWLIK